MFFYFMRPLRLWYPQGGFFQPGVFFRLCFAAFALCTRKTSGHRKSVFVPLALPVISAYKKKRPGQGRAAARKHRFRLTVLMPDARKRARQSVRIAGLFCTSFVPNRPAEMHSTPEAAIFDAGQGGFPQAPFAAVKEI
ncbi:MAG: hypothetical protein ACLVEL_04645 [Ruthenibacterium sp.]